MKVRNVVLVSGAVLFVVLASSRPVTGATQTHLLVDDDKVECPTAAYTRIQDAVNAAPPGASIRVCAGTYVEQVSIKKPLQIHADSGAILMPSAMQQNTTSLVNNEPLAAALLVLDANGVTINGLVVDGANAGISQCAPVLFGILYQNSSGTIEHVAVRNFKLGSGLGGCQSGSGIFVQSGGGGTSQVAIEKSTVHDFQKNGITANEVGTQATINENVVTGIGLTTGAAQNGIQIGFGAGGSISGNTVTNTVWASCTSVNSCAAVAANILVAQSNGITVTRNTAGINNAGIFIDSASDSAVVENNQTFATSVFDGIHVEGNQATIRSNHVFNGAESGIFISGNNNVIELNTITEAAIGILKASGTTGNLIQNNHIYDSPIAVQDPSSVKLEQRISPLR